MVQRLLFFLFIFSSFSVYSQIQGPPPGILDYYKCDPEGDGVEVFDLASHFLFPFNVSGEEASNYNPLTFYLTEEDRNNGVNPIADPSNYVNISNPQKIYFRTYAINPGAYVYLEGGEFIHASQIPSPNLKNTLILCDDNGNGFNTFNLSKSREEILAGLDSGIYNLNYYETLVDAENEVNRITNVTSYNNSTNPQKVYVRVLNRFDETCYSIVELDLKVQGICQDLEVFLLPLLPPRPGFINEYRLYVNNLRDDSSISGRIQFNYDSFLELISVTEVGAGKTITNISNGFFLDIDNLSPNNSTYVSINIKTPISVPLGTVLVSEAVYLGTDYNLNNNYSRSTQTVVGSYDPNDITESHGPDILYSDFSNDDYLYYRVRFQNVGTADAINVSINNILNAKLDKSTIQMLTASHYHVFTRTDNQLNWKFDNIHLPSEDMDEPNSHGYVYYKIKPLAGYSIGDIIPNTAEIYFDFNPAVVTNTFNTEFTTTLSSKRFNKADFSISPNPATEMVELKFNKIATNEVHVNVYNIQGKLILNTNDTLQNNAIHINVASLESGMYFLKIGDGKNEVTQKLVIK
ncbi:T9SS type A sorting domain-containing protein [Flavivirga eckloniae]|uniref:Uncharacterized protein n=1 Tax=Flavivirga eckloniae TaxID=1803846 RepID=A0A2K9PUX4_9FLAO|nr:T9SS type A sorting domain-containing protein [Flavivirga eckloniae]AUP80863.1 hypothetical protein C1H87_19975 [Flavivirga eckloniae]